MKVTNIKLFPNASILGDSRKPKGQRALGKKMKEEDQVSYLTVLL